MSDDGPEPLLPPTLTNSSCNQLSPPTVSNPFGGSSQELQDKIQRQREEKRVWNDDPADKDEGDFWFEVPFRKRNLEAKKLLTRNAAAPDAVALATRNVMLFRIDEAIDALPKDEEEVRSALPAKMKATIEQIRSRWKALDELQAVLIPAGFSRVAEYPDQSMSPVVAADIPAIVAVEDAPIYRTGMQGRPSSSSLIAAQLERRREAGQTLDTQVAEADALAAWLVQEHPEAPKTGSKAIRTSLTTNKALRAAVKEVQSRKRPK
jgi:hypothetical protein